MDIPTLTSVLGWCTVLGIGFMTLTLVAVLGLRSFMTGVHQKMFGLDEADLARAYFRYLAQLKALIVVFALIPYLALKIVG